MSAQKHSLQTQYLTRFGIDFIYIRPCFDYFSNIWFYLVFIGETLENARDGAVQEAWRRVVQKSTQRHDVVGKSQQTLSLIEAIKGRENPIKGV